MEAPAEPARITGVSSRAWYGASITDFLKAQPDTIVGQLVRNGNFALLPTQKDAWLAQIRFLQDRLVGLTGALFLEFNIPRMGRRIDTVLLVGPVVFVIEFKVGESTFDRAAVDQVWDYALDLKNFHEASHSVSIVPILIATETKAAAPLKLHADEDKVYRPPPDTERLGLMPFIFRRSLTGRVGSTISAEGAVAGRMRATRCRCEVTTTSSPDLTRSDRGRLTGSHLYL